MKQIFPLKYCYFSLTDTERSGVLAPGAASVTEDQAGPEECEAFVAVRSEDRAPVLPHSHPAALDNLAQSGRITLTDCCKQRGGLSPRLLSHISTTSCTLLLYIVKYQDFF